MPGAGGPPGGYGASPPGGHSGPGGPAAPGDPSPPAGPQGPPRASRSTTVALLAGLVVVVIVTGVVATIAVLMTRQPDRPLGAPAPSRLATTIHFAPVTGTRPAPCPSPGGDAVLDDAGTTCYQLAPGVTVTSVLKVEAVADADGSYSVRVVPVPESRDRLASLTEDSLNELLAVVVSDRVVTAPRVAQKLTGDSFGISGLTKDAADAMVARLLGHGAAPSAPAATCPPGSTGVPDTGRPYNLPPDAPGQTSPSGGTGQVPPPGTTGRQGSQNGAGQGSQNGTGQVPPNGTGQGAQNGAGQQDPLNGAGQGTSPGGGVTDPAATGAPDPAATCAPGSGATGAPTGPGDPAASPGTTPGQPSSGGRAPIAPTSGGTPYLSAPSARATGTQPVGGPAATGGRPPAPSALGALPTSRRTADPRFPTCQAANAAGYGPYTKGVHEEYAWYPDRDGDGVACERGDG
ncbi:hypothetical protein Skr01_02010 [Sphaerisporangium krabiense]|nr:hypothetical protein Skr01_02010 [Sphaerisporangium krabiense]